MSLISREVHLKSRPIGEPVDSDFAIIEKTIDPPGAGEVLIQNIYMSVDPYMRGRMREAWDLDRVLEGAAVGKVIKSQNKHFQEGSYVTSSKSWREYFISDGANISPIDPDLAPISAYLGIMGAPGLTAYGGLLITGQLKEGETVFVSAASGSPARKDVTASSIIQAVLLTSDSIKFWRRPICTGGILKMISTRL